MQDNIKNFINFRIYKLFGELDSNSKEILISNILSLKNTKKLKKNLTSKTEKELIALNVEIKNIQLEKDFKMKQLKTRIEIEQLKNKKEYTEKEILSIIEKIYNVNTLYANKIAQIENLI